MINEIQLIVCDECNTVSFGELAKCAQCEKMMKPAKFIRETIVAKDEPLTLTDLPRPWSTDEMKEPTCPGCGAPYVGGEVTTHFHFCPVEKENKPLPPEVYKDFEQGQPFKDER